MHSVDFYYWVSDKDRVRVKAYCKAVVGTEPVGLKWKFLDEDDNVLDVEYDADMFSDIYEEAANALVDEYYNPELRMI